MQLEHSFQIVLSFPRVLSLLRVFSFALLLVASGVQAQSAGTSDELSSEKAADINKLLEITDAVKIGQQMGDAMIGLVGQIARQRNPGVDPADLDVISGIVSEVIRENIPGLMAISGRIYHRHFSHSEIRELIAFFQTTVGKKAIKVMPELLRESMTAGQQWGQSLMPEVRKRVNDALKDKGVTI